jgi:hypothetical protein
MPSSAAMSGSELPARDNNLSRLSPEENAVDSGDATVMHIIVTAALGAVKDFFPYPGKDCPDVPLRHWSTWHDDPVRPADAPRTLFKRPVPTLRG